MNMKKMICKPATMDVVKEKKQSTSKAESKKKKKASSQKEPEFSSGIGTLVALEPRIMFDGAALVTGAEVLQDTTTQDQTIPGTEGDASTDSSSSSTTNNDSEALWSSGLSLSAPSERKEIVFIDTSVEDFQTLMEGIDPHAEVILLDSTRDGVEQIAEILGERTDIDAVHIISHGDSGELRLGTGVLDLASMQGEYADELAIINQALSEEADFLIYGCNFGEGDLGQEASTRLAELTGADIAASDDLTGAKALGGDWDLEVQTGTIESDVVVDEQAQEEFTGVFDITSNLVAHYEMNEGSGTTATDATANNNDGTHQGSTSHVTGKIGSGALDFSTDTSGNDRVEVADDTSLDFGSGDFSVGLWFKSSTTPASQAQVIGQHAGSGDGWVFFIDSMGDFYAQIDGGGNSVSLTANGLLDGNWHHIVLVRDGDFFSLFVDNSFEDAVSVSVGSVNNTETLYIGGSTITDFDGQLDEVRLYDRALSASDVTEFFNYTGGNAPPTITNLGGDTLAYTEGAGAQVIDQSSNAGVSDVDSSDFDTGTLTVAFTAGSDSAEDVLSLRDQGTGAGQIGVSGSTVSYGGTTIGTFTGGSGGVDLVITLNANADAAAVGALTQNITYENTDTGNPTTTARTVRYVLTDGDGGTSANYDTTVTVAAQNDVPVITNLGGDTLAYTEGAGAQVIDQSSNAGVSDVDSSDFDTGTLTVAFTAGSDSAEDVLSLRDQGTGAGQIGVSGSTVSYGGTTIGTFTGGSGGVDLVITLNANADAAAVGALTQNITYENTDTNNPTTTARTVRYVLTDGDGGTSANYDTTVTVAAQNDVPVIANLGGDTLAYTEGAGAQVIDQSSNAAVSDVDSSDFDTGTLTVAFTAGSDSAEDVLSIRHQGTGAGQIGVSGSTVSYGGTTIGTFTGGSGGVDLVITLNANADAAAVGALTQNITYENTDTNNPTTTARTVRYVLTDGDGGTSANYDTTVTVAAQNDVPVITNLGGDTLAYTEGAGAQVIDQSSNAAVSDVDSSDFDTGTLTVAFTAGSDSAEDVLSLRHQGTGAGQIGVSGSTVSYGGTTIGTFTGGSGGVDLVITLNANADAAAVGALTQNITYENTDTNNPTTTARTVRYVLTDGDGGTSANYDTTVTVAAQNDVPVITNLGGDTLAYTEGAGAQVIDQSSNAGVSDVDSSDFDTGTLTVAFTAGSDSAEDVLSLRDQGTGAGQIGVSGSTVSYGGTTIGTFTGGSGGVDLVITLNANADAAAVGALTQNITYENTDTGNPTTTARTVRYVLTDGDGGTSANYDTTVTVAAQNDVPVIANLGGDTLAYTEGAGAQVIDQSSNAAVSDVDSSDFDTGTLTVAFTAGSDSAEDVLSLRHQGTGAGQIGVSGSTVSYGGTTIGTFTGGSGGVDLVITLNANADAAAVGALTQNITYENTDTGNPTTTGRTVRYVLTDGDGGTSANYDTTVTVAAQNDVPVIANLGGDTLAYTEGAGAQVIDQSSNAAVSDVDSSDFDTGTLTVAFTAGSDSAEDVLSLRHQGTGAGQIGVSGSTVSYGGTTIGTFTGGSGGVDLVITLNANADAAAVGALTQNITYENTDTGNPTTTARTVRYVLTDGDGGTSANYDTTVTVSGVNDAPTFSIGDGTVITDVGSTLDLGASSVIQPDGKILVAGHMHNGTNTDFAVVRYNTDGSLDTSFSGDGMLTTDIGASSDYGKSVTLQPDGKILVAGHTHAGGSNDFALVRYNSDGTLDTSFSGDGKLTTEFSAGAEDLATSVVVQPDGKILVGGHTSTAGDSDFALVRYNSDGTLDTSFSGDGRLTTDIGAVNDTANSVTVQPDGKILLAGYSDNDLALVRYNADGTLDTSFDTDGILTTSVGSIDRGIAVTVQPDGKILVAGFTTGPTFDFIVVRYHTDGTLDTSFSGDGIAADPVGPGLDLVYDIALQADNKILVAGYSTVGSVPHFAVIRYNTDGTLDTSFSGDGKLTTSLGPESDIASSINVQTDGKIVVAGTTSVGSDGDFAVVRYHSDGTLDTSFDSAFTNTLDGAPSFAEGGAAVVLDADVNISDSELDSFNGGNGNYSGASLTLVRNGGANSEDVFSFNAGNGITLSSGTLIKNSQIIATFDTTATLGQLVITFTDVNGEIPTSADVDNILRQITYSNSSDNPPASAQIDWSFHDGNTGSQGSGGAKQATGSTTVTITAVNDIPVITNLGGDTLAYTEGAGAQVIDQSSNAAVSDVDSSDFDTGTLTVAFTAGSDSAEDVLSIRHQGTGAGQIGVSGSTVSYGGTTIGTFTGGSGGVDLVITLNANADAAAVGALTQNITYENTDTGNPTTTARTVRYVLTDGDGGTSANYDTTVTVAAQNDVPVITNLGGDTLAYTEGAGAQVIDQSSNAGVSDVDSSDFDTGTLTVAFTAGSDSAEDVLSLRDQGTGAGQIGVSGSTVSYGGTTIGTFTGGSGGVDLVITLNANADAAAVGALTQNITYENTDTGNPTTTARTVRYVLTDGDGGTSANYDTTVTVSGINDAPVISSHGGGASAAFSMAENLTTVSTITATDVDGGLLAYSIVGGADAGRFAIDASSGVLRFVAAPDFEQPTDAGGNNIYDVVVQVDDGRGGIDMQSLAVTVTDVYEGGPVLPPSPPTPPSPPPPTPPSPPAPNPTPDPGPPVVLPSGPNGFVRGEDLASRGLDAESLENPIREVSDVAELPPLFRSDSLATISDQIRAYYPDPLDIANSQLSPEILQQLNTFSDELEDTLEETTEKRSFFVDMVKNSGLALSASFVAWLVRGGTLVAGLMTSLPAWRHFDPVPILGMNKNDKEAWTRRVHEAAKMEVQEHGGLDQILGSQRNECSNTSSDSSTKSS